MFDYALVVATLAFFQVFNFAVSYVGEIATAVTAGGILAVATVSVRRSVRLAWEYRGLIRRIG